MNWRHTLQFMFNPVVVAIINCIADNSSKWKHKDFLEYVEGKVEFYIYDAREGSTSYSMELGEKEEQVMTVCGKEAQEKIITTADGEVLAVVSDAEIVYTGDEREERGNEKSRPKIETARAGFA